MAMVSGLKIAIDLSFYNVVLEGKSQIIIQALAKVLNDI